MRLAVWSRQLEQVDKGNPALTFIREMQSSAQSAAALTSLALYKPAAASIRTTIETALYYTYFRTHHEEMATLVRESSYFVQKSDIVQYHNLHTKDFKANQSQLGLLSRLDKSYSSLSAVVHGQIPGTWTFSSLKGLSPNAEIKGQVVSHLVEAEEIVHRLLISTVGRAFWDDFSSSAKKALLRGMAGDLKLSLGLDHS